ncbi:MAG: alpha-ketoacid dehydrogenase subunit beta [Chloroflexi bacterium]|nr:alpha-ketoacid dehydrogenase subunit beta [Chloroflexota bacterium]
MPVMTYREALALTLREALQEDERVFIMGEDIGAYGGTYAVTRGFLAEFGERRIRDMPIAESIIVGSAVGAAMAGLRPVVELMTINFSLLAMDQIVNHAAKVRYMSGGQVKVPLVIRVPSGGGNLLGAQHSQSLEGWYAHVPGLKVVAPSTPADARGLLRAALRDDNTVLFVENALLYGTKGEVPEGKYEIPLGRADIKRAGSQVTLVSYSRLVLSCLEAAQRLAGEGIEVEVIDLRSLRPLDMDTVLASVKRTRRAVVAEETWKTGGFGGEVISLIYEGAFDHLDAPVGWVAGAEVPMPYARNLEKAALPTADDVIKAVKKLF